MLPRLVPLRAGHEPSYEASRRPPFPRGVFRPGSDRSGWLPGDLLEPGLYFRAWRHPLRDHSLPVPESIGRALQSYAGTRLGSKTSDVAGEAIGVSEAFLQLSPLMQAVVAGLFTWAITALGAASVFLRRDMPDIVLDAMLGFAAGVMIAASFWSLLAPSIELAEAMGQPGWLPAGVGFVLGAATLFAADQLLPHVHPYLKESRPEGISTTWQRTTLLVTAITLHNIPEGLAIGVAFGAAAMNNGAMAGATLASAIALSIGIGLQNFPEGVAVAMPLRREGVSRFRSFWYGQLSAAVEPVAALAGAATVLSARYILPYALAFAAGAMIFVVVEELIPEAQESGHTDLATIALIVGFTVMMILDVALG